MTERDTTAGILIRDGKVLVAQRIKGGALSEQWEFPGGKNRYGESLQETLKREYMEELGIDVDVHEEIATCEFINKDVHYTLHAFLISASSSSFSLSVHTDTAFADKGELSSLSMGESDSTIRSYVLDNLL